MKLTHKIIQEESEVLKKHLQDGDVEIPSMWSCAWPGLLLILWLTLWPAFVFDFLTTPSEGTLIAMGFGAFLGVIVFFGMFNFCSIYLSLSINFRETSKVIHVLRKKTIVYFVVFIIINFLTGFLADNSKAGALQYLFPTVVSLCILGFIMSADIGRYRLSAFTSVLELIKSHKQQGGDE